MGTPLRTQPSEPSSPCEASRTNGSIEVGIAERRRCEQQSGREGIRGHVLRAYSVGGLDAHPFSLPCDAVLLELAPKGGAVHPQLPRCGETVATMTFEGLTDDFRPPQLDAGWQSPPAQTQRTERPHSKSRAGGGSAR